VPFFVYILRCRDNSYYVGHCLDVPARVLLHNSGEGAKYTKDHGPVTPVYTEKFDSEAEAVRRERQLKGWSWAKKDALVRGDKEELRRLAKRRA
jgi:predicted GIY-YIG superfamily endonuclease